MARSRALRDGRSTSGAIDAQNLLTTRDVAALLRVHPKHVYRLMRRELPALRVGDEWRFNRDEVLRWATRAGPGSSLAAATGNPAVPGLVAANGDLAIEILLDQARQRDSTLLGLVIADHGGATWLLAQSRVLAAGSHADVENPGVTGDHELKTMRLQLVTREVGLAYRGSRIRQLGSLVGKRIATRPVTAGIRQRLDCALLDAGVDLSAAYARAAEHSCHRNVALSVARGEAELGLTTHAWARAAGLSFLAVAEEQYDLSFIAENVGDTRIVALCEAAQTIRFRRQLRQCAGYAVTRTGRLRAG